MSIATLKKSKTLINLQNEEIRLQHRRDMRKKSRGGKRRKNISHAQIHSSSSLNLTKEADFGGRNPVLSQYKNKLCLFMVEEINEAYKAITESSSLSGSEVGLSIDEEDSDSAAGKKHNFEVAESTVRSLFYQVSSKVPSHIKTQLRFSKDVYFYELISSQVATGLSTFVEHSLLEKCRALVSIETFPVLFSMVFYRYADFFMQDKTLWNVFVKGVGQVFQHDANQGTIRLTALYHSLKESKSIKSHPQLMKTMMRFYFYYCSSNIKMVNHFLAKYEITFEVFLLENLAVLEKNSNESISERYLKCISVLKQAEEFDSLSQESIHKLNSVLTGFTISGAPYNPTSKLRKAAQESLDICFPKARLARRVISGVLQLDFKGVAVDLISTFSPFNIVSA